jgi:hypothetical protein
MQPVALVPDWLCASGPGGWLGWLWLAWIRVARKVLHSFLLCNLARSLRRSYLLAFVVPLVFLPKPRLVLN